MGRHTVLKLRDYQEAAVQSVFDYWRREKGNPLIVGPCGSGKSLMIAALVQRVMAYPGTRVLVLAHRKELLEQNEAELQRMWPGAPTGFFSAGIGQKDYHAPILFAGIQTIAKRITHFEPFGIVVIDESHLIPRRQQTQYGQTIAHLSLMRPTCRFVGFTATPYRLDSGMLHKGEGALFDEITYDIKIKRLIDDGHLCPIVSRSGRQTADMTGVKRRGGEFVAKDMAAAFDKDDLLRNACEQVISEGRDRRAWLLFCASVEQAERATEYMLERGVQAECVTGKDSKAHREQTIERFRAGRLRCLVNVDILTIGFNAPICDLLALIRATDSTALYVQVVGRAMRTYHGKQDALLLDFGGNVERHGPIDDVVVRQPGEGGGEAPAKACPECMLIVHASVATCPDCGYQFPPPQPRVEQTAYRGAVLSFQRTPERLPVIMTSYHIHSKQGKPDSVRVQYVTGQKTIQEWLMPEHGGYATQKTAKLIADRYGERCPTTSAELLAMLRRQPKPIYVHVLKRGQFFDVTKVETEAPAHHCTRASDAPSTRGGRAVDIVHV